MYYLDTGAGVTVAPTPYAHLQVCVLSKPLQYFNCLDLVDHVKKKDPEVDYAKDWLGQFGLLPIWIHL